MNDQIIAAYKQYGALVRKLTLPLLHRLNWTYSEHTTFVYEVLWQSIESYQEAYRPFIAHLKDVAIRRARGQYTAWNRHKHRVLNNAISTDIIIEDREGRVSNIAYDFAAPVNVHAEVQFKELVSEFSTWLSPLELAVFHAVSDGYKGKAMSQALGVPVKVADNALCRVQEKLTRYLAGERYKRTSYNTKWEVSYERVSG